MKVSRVVLCIVLVCAVVLIGVVTVQQEQLSAYKTALDRIASDMQINYELQLQTLKELDNCSGITH